MDSVTAPPTHTTSVFDSVLDAIGNTPIVRINQLGEATPASLYAKLEFTNPGGSIKDRIGYYLIEDAERRGVLKPGDTIIEGTSGNTGVGLAMAAAIKGYPCIFILPDKMSNEKIRNLRAFGARVIVTPTSVAPEDPRSYYSVCKQMAKDMPNALYMDQYNNLANSRYHYTHTGPEILQQMPDIDVFIAGIGTGGTISGVGRYLKEHKPGVEIISVDPIGSIVYDTFKYGEPRSPAESYLIEGIGEDFIPANYDFDQIDDMVQVADKESFLMTRELLTREGIYAGVSSGSVLVGALRWLEQQGERMKDKKVLMIFPDSGNRYMSKVYDDDWMQEVGFLTPTTGTVAELLRHMGTSPETLLTAHQADSISKVISQFSESGVSQLPVLDDNGWVKGIARESTVLKAMYQHTVRVSDSIDQLTDTAIEFVSPSTPISQLSRLLTDGKVPLVTENDTLLGIITDIDLLNYFNANS